MIALSAAASVGRKRESRRLWLAAASKKIGRRQEMLRPSVIRPKHGGLGGKGIDRIFLQCGDAATGSRGFDSKGEPDAADWKFAVASAGGAQRRTLAALESLGLLILPGVAWDGPC